MLLIFILVVLAVIITAIMVSSVTGGSRKKRRFTHSGFDDIDIFPSSFGSYCGTAVVATAAVINFFENICGGGESWLENGQVKIR